MNISSPHHWPAEWEPQEATWISWPHNRDTWPDRFADIPPQFYRFIATICETQPVHVLACESVITEQNRAQISDLPNVSIHEILTNDAWIRDYGPTFTIRKDDQTLVGVDWKYNAWGGKYPPFDKDAAATEAICRVLRCQRSVSSMYCEGGALETNGQGVLLTTGNCLLSPNRNPGWTPEMVEAELQLQLGIKKVIWVDGGGLQGDDTDGHIDQLARFVNPSAIVAATSSSKDDPNYRGLQENVRILSTATGPRGERFEVYTLPTPPPRFVGATRVPESYCNFLITNQRVIVPTFRNEETDRTAVGLLESLFPTRKVVPLDAYDISWGLGAFHCASQQQPRAKSLSPL